MTLRNRLGPSREIRIEAGEISGGSVAIIDDVDLQAVWDRGEGIASHVNHEPSLKRRLEGDTYVVVRHYSNLTERVRRNLWALGLWSTGDAVTVDSSSHARRGQIFVAQDDVQVIPTTAAAFSTWHELPWCRPLLSAPRPGSLRIDRYENGDLPAALLYFENGEFVRCEVSTEHFTLKWSSALPVRSMLAAVTTAFPGSTDELVTSAAFSDGVHIEGPLESVTETAVDHASDLDVFRVRTGNAVFGWMANLVAHDSSKDVILNQCAVVSRMDAAAFEPIFISTATPALGAASEKVFKLVRDLTRSWSGR